MSPVSSLRSQVSRNALWRCSLHLMAIVTLIKCLTGHKSLSLSLFFTKIWKISRNLDNFQKSGWFPEIRKFSKNQKIFGKSEFFWKIWKISENLKMFTKIWKFAENLEIFLDIPQGALWLIFQQWQQSVSYLITQWRWNL